MVDLEAVCKVCVWRIERQRITVVSLYNEVVSLYNGVVSLYNGVVSLYNGVVSLHNGVVSRHHKVNSLESTFCIKQFKTI